MSVVWLLLLVCVNVYECAGCLRGDQGHCTSFPAEHHPFPGGLALAWFSSTNVTKGPLQLGTEHLRVPHSLPQDRNTYLPALRLRPPHEGDQGL